MSQTHWHLHAPTGFLLHQPLQHLTPDAFPVESETIERLETAASKLQTWIANGQADNLLDGLQDVDWQAIQFDCLNTLVLERLFLLYGYFTSAWVHGFGKSLIPAAIAQPFAAIAKRVQRPPILSYAGQVLGNWMLRNPEAGFTPQNILLLQTFTHLVDESWFFRVHIAIEAQSGKMLYALSSVNAAIDTENDMAVLDVLRTLQTGLVQITKTFHNMPDLCDPDVYYQDVRPYLMSFDKNVIFEGVDPNPVPLRGGSGAQSSVVPALLAGLRLEHESSELIHSLMDMRRYMPVEHQAFIQHMREIRLREYCKTRPHLADAYNHVLRQLMTFRRAHLYYARTYIFEKSINPVGTGGTEYMSFLSKLIDETANFML
jgi:indoleamine 2,3-dioxygenase